MGTRVRILGNLARARRHHLQPLPSVELPLPPSRAGIVTAAVFSDAAHIVEEIALLKTRTSGSTNEDRGGG